MVIAEEGKLKQATFIRYQQHSSKEISCGFGQPSTTNNASFSRKDTPKAFCKYGKFPIKKTSVWL